MRPEHPPEFPLAVHDLTVAYHRKPVLWDVELNIPEGTLAGIVGPNGAGKSTLLKACLELIPKTSGEALIYGKPYETQRDLIAYVPQRESVDWDFPVSALDVVIMGTYRKLGWFKRITKIEKQQALEALEKVGISHLAQRQISQLSGGQQQRVFLARALVQDAEIYFMDEPFAALDAITREELQDDLLRLTKLRNSTVLFVTHDIAEAVYLSDHVAVMEDGAMSITTPIKLTGHRNADTRYDPDFNATCRKIRTAMATPASEAA